MGGGGTYLKLDALHQDQPGLTCEPKQNVNTKLIQNLQLVHEPRSDKVDKYTITMILTEESAHEF